MRDLTYFTATTPEECKYVVEEMDINNVDKNEDGLTWIELACKNDNFHLFDAYKTYFEHMPYLFVWSAIKYGSIKMVIYSLEHDPHDVEYDIDCPPEDVVETYKSPSIYALSIKYERPDILEFLYKSKFQDSDRYYCNNNYHKCALEYAIYQDKPNYEIIKIILNYYFIRNLSVGESYAHAIKLGCSMDIINLFNQFDMCTQVKFNDLINSNVDLLTSIIVAVFTTSNPQNIDAYFANVISQFGIQKVINNDELYLAYIFNSCSMPIIKKVCRFLYENDVHWWTNMSYYVGFAMNNKSESFYVMWDYINNFEFDIFADVSDDYTILDHAVYHSHVRYNLNIYKTILTAMFKKDANRCKQYAKTTMQRIKILLCPNENSICEKEFINDVEKFI
jgi:hypothetical protein